MMRHPLKPIPPNITCWSFFFAVGLLVFRQAAQAQCPAPNIRDATGGFSVSETRGCVPLTVTVRKNDAAVQNETYWFNYPATVINYKTFEPYRMMRAPRTNGELDTTYRTPGRYVIVQIGSKGGTASYACQVVEVLPNDRPTNYSVSSCNPGEITLTIRNDPAFKFDDYQVYWDASQTTGVIPERFLPGDTKSHRYPNSLSRQIRIVGRYNGLGCTAVTDVTVSPSGPNPTPPRITRLEVTDASTARLEYAAPSGSTVDIFQKDAGGAYVKRFDGVGGPFQTITGLDNATKQHCFQVRNTGAGCLTQPLQSEELCTIPLTATAQNQQNMVRWTAHPTPRTGVTFGGYALTRNGAPLQQYPTIGSTSYTDTQVECGRQYSYQVTATIRAGANVMTSVSQSVPIVAINNTPPPPVTDVVASVTAPNQVELRWLKANPSMLGALFTVSRAVNGSNDYVRVGDNTDTAFTDQVNASDNSYCYRISYQDLCSNNATPSEPVCTVLLQREGESLGWSSESPFNGGFGPLRDYTVELIDSGNAATTLSNTGSRTDFALDLASASSQQLRYRIRATSARGIQSFSNVIALTLAMRLYVPDAFTPNGDGINDAFSVQGLFIKAFKMTVFNRWGAPIFRTETPDPGWDGTFNGQVADAGSYTYAIEAEDFRGETFVKRGSFLLLR